jgi:hypothetical protein
MKECNCDECEGYQEGFCIMAVLYPGYDPSKCDAKSNADLITEDEYNEMDESMRKIIKKQKGIDFDMIKNEVKK